MKTTVDFHVTHTSVLRMSKKVFRYKPEVALGVPGG
jgi:hypothetical protein